MAKGEQLELKKQEIVQKKTEIAKTVEQSIENNPFAKMVLYFEDHIFSVQGIKREAVLEVIKKAETEKGWNFNEMYESLEEVKGSSNCFWKLKDKLLQKLGAEICQKKRFFYEKRRLEIDMFFKIEKLQETLAKVKTDKKWISKEGEKTLGKLRKKLSGIEKIENKLENENKKIEKYNEAKRKEKEREEKKRKKEEEKARIEREREKVRQEKERIKKEKEKLKEAKLREKMEKERQKQLQKEQARLEKERIKEQKEKAKLEKEKARMEKEKAKLEQKNKEFDLLVKKNSSMMDFFNQSKANLKRVKNEENHKKGRWSSLGTKKGFGQVCPNAFANFEKVITKEIAPVTKNTIIERFKAKRLKLSNTKPDINRVIFNRFESYDGECVERRGVYSKKSSVVNGRNPLARDTAIIEYELDTEDEMEAESCKSRISEEEDDEELLNEEDGGFIVSDLSCEEGEQKRERRVVKKLEPKLTDLRFRRNASFSGWLRMGEAGKIVRGSSGVVNLEDEISKIVDQGEGIRMNWEGGKINFNFLRREEIAKKKMEEEKERKKQERLLEKKLEIEKNKKKNEVKPNELLSWAQKVFGKSSKKELLEGGQNLLKHLKINDLEAFKDQWSMTYYANLEIFKEFFGVQKGLQMYYDCLFNKKNASVYESLTPKHSPRKNIKEEASKKSLKTFFQSMKAVKKSQESNPKPPKNKKKITKTEKDQKKALKKDPANIRKLDEMILIFGTGASKKQFDTIIFQKIKQKFNYFSDRKIIMRIKEILRFGYLLPKDFFFSLLTSHQNKYLKNEEENIPKKNLLTMFKKSSSDNQFANVPKRIVEDFFFQENLHLKLQQKFTATQPIEKKA